MASAAVSQRGAWTIYEQLSRDDRVFFAAEPSGVEEIWKAASLPLLSGTNLWTDAYLTAFAQGHSWTLVTFDKGFSRLRAAGFPVVLLE
jgi:predicted nucleic acid-binding protein